MDEKEFLAAYGVMTFIAKLDSKTVRWLIRCLENCLERERAEAAKGGS